MTNDGERAATRARMDDPEWRALAFRLALVLEGVQDDAAAMLAARDYRAQFRELAQRRGGMA